MSDVEEPLPGGNATAVSRRGDAVHRDAGPWTDSVHALLVHVRERGIAWVPEPRGRDDAGREVLSYVEGHVPSYPMPDWVWREQVLIDAAQRLRAYHDATVDFPRAERRWRLPAHTPDEVICHNDFAPYNFAFDDGTLVGVIDFDTASPGPRVWDLAYLAHRLIPLTAGDADAVDALRAVRLHQLCAAYGAGIAPDAVLAVVPPRLEELAAFTAAQATDGGPAELRDHVAIYHADAAYVRTRLAALLAPNAGESTRVPAP